MLDENYKISKTLAANELLDLSPFLATLPDGSANFLIISTSGLLKVKVNDLEDPDLTDTAFPTVTKDAFAEFDGIDTLVPASINFTLLNTPVLPSSIYAAYAEPFSEIRLGVDNGVGAFDTLRPGFALSVIDYASGSVTFSHSAIDEDGIKKDVDLTIGYQYTTNNYSFNVNNFMKVGTDIDSLIVKAGPLAANITVYLLKTV